jgi:hypothetical protein
VFPYFYYIISLGSPIKQSVTGRMGLDEESPFADDEVCCNQIDSVPFEFVHTYHPLMRHLCYCFCQYSPLLQAKTVEADKNRPAMILAQALQKHSFDRVSVVEGGFPMVVKVKGLT